MTSFPASAILFDCDGVLVDSLVTAEAAWDEWAVHYGLDAETVKSDMHGKRAAETVALFIEGEDARAEALALIVRLEVEAAGGTVPLPGARELLDAMSDAEAAVVTSGTRDLAIARLRAAGIRVPAVVITAESVERGKPAPDPYLAGAAALGVPIERCIVVEDSHNGIAAGRAAGAGAIIGVSSAAGGAAELDADATVASLAELSWRRAESGPTVVIGA